MRSVHAPVQASVTVWLLAGQTKLMLPRYSADGDTTAPWPRRRTPTRSSSARSSGARPPRTRAPRRTTRRSLSSRRRTCPTSQDAAGRATAPRARPGRRRRSSRWRDAPDPVAISRRVTRDLVLAPPLAFNARWSGTCARSRPHWFHPSISRRAEPATCQASAAAARLAARQCHRQTVPLMQSPLSRRSR